MRGEQQGKCEWETEVSGLGCWEGNKDYEGIVKIGTTRSYQINNSY